MEGLRPRPHAAVHSAHRVFNDSVAGSPLQVPFTVIAKDQQEHLHIKHNRPPPSNLPP